MVGVHKDAQGCLTFQGQGGKYTASKEHPPLLADHPGLPSPTARAAV